MQVTDSSQAQTMYVNQSRCLNFPCRHVHSQHWTNTYTQNVPAQVFTSEVHVLYIVTHNFMSGHCKTMSLCVTLCHVCVYCMFVCVSHSSFQAYTPQLVLSLLRGVLMLCLLRISKTEVLLVIVECQPRGVPGIQETWVHEVAEFWVI